MTLSFHDRPKSNEPTRWGISNNVGNGRGDLFLFIWVHDKNVVAVTRNL
jgi:hypothetical protein